MNESQDNTIAARAAQLFGTALIMVLCYGGRVLHAQCNDPDNGPGDTMAPVNDPYVYDDPWKYCTYQSWLFGQKCFPMGTAWCGFPSTITVGQSYTVEASATVDGVGVKVGTTFTASQQFGPCGGPNKRCQFWVCYADSGIFDYHCQRYIGFWSYENNYSSFVPGTPTVYCCCAPANCFAGGEDKPPEDVETSFGEGGLDGRHSVNVDLATYFTPFFAPPPDHPLSGPHAAFSDLTEWHLCQLQALADLDSNISDDPVEEIVVFDVDGTGHHFLLDADPFPFWGTELSQNSSLAVTPLSGVTCYDDTTGVSNATAFARSYDLSSIPGIAGAPYTINGVVVGIEVNTGSDLIGTINIYTDTDGGAPVGPGTDLVLLGSKGLVIPGTPDRPYLTAALDAPLVVPADSMVVVELELPAHTDGGVWPGSNAAAQSGPTYIRSADCGVATYVDLATVGFPDTHWVQVIVGTSGVAPCLADANGDGVVNAADLLAVINAWGACPIPCPPYCAADSNQDCSVNVADLLAVLNAWGPC